MSDNDKEFFERADDYINLANEQLAKANRGKVSASMMFGTARFNAWLSACEFETAEELKAAKPQMIKYFLEEYEKMLSENIDDYVKNFDKYTKGMEG